MARTDIKKTIIEAAKPLFARFAFKKTSVDELARAAGVSKATLYAYFDSKEALFAAVVHSEGTRIFAGMDAAIAAAPTYEAKLRAFFTSFLKLLAESQLIREASSETLAQLLPLARDVSNTLETQGRARLRALVQGGVDTGEFDLEDIELTTRGLNLAAHSLHLVFIHDRDADQATHDIPAFLDILLRGLTKGSLTP
ncbi:MAG: TetR/AcrR family transcriptional regulator [Deltaproteobacteria bacterium]|nr:TetR/AcrR family transcriptional regulator [Deltaproteobacteria bacterium]